MAYRVSNYSNGVLISYASIPQVRNYIQESLQEAKDNGNSITLIIEEETDPEILAEVEEYGFSDQYSENLDPLRK